VIDLGQPKIEFVMMASRAAIVNGGLYAEGGGMDLFWAEEGQYRVPFPFAVIISVLIPWSASGRRFPLRLRLEDADARELENTLGVDISANVTPGTPEGQSFRHVSVHTPQWSIPSPGAYVAVAQVNGEHEGRTIFTVRPRLEEEPERLEYRPS
jgi:hypothetical protein